MSVLNLKMLEEAMAKLPKPDPSRTIDQVLLRNEFVPREDPRYWTHQLERLGEMLGMPVEVSTRPSIMGIPVIVSRTVPENKVMFVMQDKTIMILDLKPPDGGK